MKKINFAICFFLLFLLNGCVVNKKTILGRINTTFFIDCSKGYDSIISYSVNGTNGLQPIVTLRKRKQQEWIKTNNINRTGYGLSDSSFNSECDKCIDIIQKIIKNGILTLPTESQISTKCKFAKDTLIDGKRVSEVKELDAIADIEQHIIEYKFGKKSRVISYRSPIVALQICPNSLERLKFLTILEELSKN